VAGVQESTLMTSQTWYKQSVDINMTGTNQLTPDTYYMVVKGLTPTDKGFFQIQAGDPAARKGVASVPTKTTTVSFTPPTWDQTKQALVGAGIKVLPLVATGGPNDSVTLKQSQVLAQATGAVTPSGTALVQQINSDGTGSAGGLVSSIQQLSQYLKMDVSLVPADGPDPGASKFLINVAPINSLGCQQPHPLLDPVTGNCQAKTTSACLRSACACNTQYDCLPGSTPKFTVTFTNPASAPVPPNPSDPFGGYHFTLQLRGNGKYVLDTIPVYIIPTDIPVMQPPPPAAFQTLGVYEQDVFAGACRQVPGPDGGFVIDPNSKNTVAWSDIFYDANIPDGTSVDFEICTADTAAGLTTCSWVPTAGRQKVTVQAKGTCIDDSQCQGITGFGDGYCTAYGTCQFINAQKIAYDLPCTSTSGSCPNGPDIHGNVIASKCDTSIGRCVYTSQPADIGETLPTGENGKYYARIRVTLHADPSASKAPTLYSWYVTYNCADTM
jgi:hypothetical protein